MNTHRFARLAAFAGLLAFTAPLLAQTPEWIWFNKTTSAEVRFFRKTFSVEGAVTKAELTATADDGLDAFVNGERVLTSDDWHNGVKVDVTAKLHAGANAVALRAHNGDGSPAGAIAQLVVTTAGGKQTIVTDATWKAAVAEAKDWNKADFNDSAWGKANSLGKMGVQPWGNVFGAVAANGGAKAAKAARGGSGRREAPAAENLFTLPDFKVELIHNAESDEGSWVNLCKDNRGRLIISPQFGKASSAEEENRRGLLRVTLAPNGSVAKREWIAQPLYDAQGMVFANGALWVAVNKYSTKFESGLYRVTDDGTDTWRNIELIKKIPGGGEHGPHAVELGPDGNIYVMAGNHTKLVDSIAPTSPHKNFQEDHVLPRQWDGNGHAAGILAPGGQI
ncbi:MAG: hypothetical protein HY300_00395, partial [Verrucomicrobia bacterium]|nr:hypothetical protein [Verrucomicrobiota bacterium]